MSYKQVRLRLRVHDHLGFETEQPGVSELVVGTPLKWSLVLGVTRGQSGMGEAAMYVPGLVRDRVGLRACSRQSLSGILVVGRFPQAVLGVEQPESSFSGPST